MEVDRAPTSVIFLGDQGVGKTSLISRKNYGELRTEVQQTVGVNNYPMYVRNEKLIVYDTAGQERYRAIVSSHLRGDIFVICFDMKNQSTLESADYWIEKVRNNCNNPHFIFVGTKIDMLDEDINSQVAEEKARDVNADVVYTSSMTGQGIDELFNLIAEIAQDVVHETQQSIHIIDDENQEEVKRKCC
ncbi:Ras-related protein Rab-6.1 [Tritrichomonas foetus]|uniref:Ras-related protein Rab-6.1 n=1 Tax=Tritrichomonas foetus TaxID=1144522 RepID=A0A1J4JQY3_9EUKA|nr:Ras-related protein Rab-6.1 [Tritrichomonas foetus]|eukprot:OHT00824.1 Ras-related protein Rab-6.1 [Tritrichomonas foetus]